MFSNQFIQLVVVMILIYVAMEDLVKFRIANNSVIILFLLFFIFSLSNGTLWPTVWHVVFGVVMFALVLLAYSFGLLGGGDAKLLSVAFLWMGLENTALFCFLLAAAALVYLVAHRQFHILPGRTNEAGKFVIPYGPCIAAAWIGTTVLRTHS